MSLLAILIPVIVLSIIGLILSFCIQSVKKVLAPQGDCTLTINDEHEEKGQAGATLLDNLLGLGYGIPAPCGGKATCHQCKVRVTEGGGEPCEVETMIFTPKKIKEGWRLSCQCKVKGPIKIHVDSSSLNVATFKAKVISNHNVSTFIKELCVEVPKDQTLSYIPGDYMQLHIPPFATHTSHWKETMEDKYEEDWHNYQMFTKDIRFSDEGEMRAYSLASYPKEGNILKFTVRIATPPFKNRRIHPRIQWGLGSSYVFSLKEGDEVELSGPYGESHMIDDDRELVFLIGGAGASFARAHIMDLFKGKQTKRKVSLWYGARSLKENIYEDEFRDLEKEFENFSYYLVLSEPEEKDIEAGWPKEDPIKTGFAFKAFQLGQLDDMEAPEDALYYVCGPPIHNKSVMKMLHDYGVERSSIVLDDFGN